MIDLKEFKLRLALMGYTKNNSFTDFESWKTDEDFAPSVTITRNEIMVSPLAVFSIHEAHMAYDQIMEVMP